jgi:chromosome segregation ATPase
MSWKGGFAMLNEAVKKFKAWIIREDVDSFTLLLSKYSREIDDFVISLESRIKQLEAAEKSRAEAMDFIASSEESIKPVCDDCVSMRLEMNALRSATDEMKARLEALETAGKGGGEGGTVNNMYAAPATPKQRRRRKSDAKELVV